MERTQKQRGWKGRGSRGGGGEEARDKEEEEEDGVIATWSRSQ